MKNVSILSLRVSLIPYLVPLTMLVCSLAIWYIAICEPYNTIIDYLFLVFCVYTTCATIATLSTIRLRVVIRQFRATHGDVQRIFWVYSTLTILHIIIILQVYLQTLNPTFSVIRGYSQYRISNLHYSIIAWCCRLLIATSIVVLYRNVRSISTHVFRMAINYCSNCGYDLSMSLTLCPECGATRTINVRQPDIDGGRYKNVQSSRDMRT
jgi:hypothetical protein